MNGKVLKAFTVTEYGALISATIAVLVFQFLPSVVLIISALSLYVVSFLIIMLRSTLNMAEVIIASFKDRRVTSLDAVTSKVEVVNTKKECALAIIFCLFWMAAFAFSLAVLIMYCKRI